MQANHMVCSTWNILTSFPAASLMKCTGGTVFSSSSAYFEGNHLDLAKGMVENFFFEIENYGGILNANRTYYLTRSQPPFLSSMVSAVYEAQVKQGQPDPHWLGNAYNFVVRDYEQWNQPPHLAGETRLSR